MFNKLYTIDFESYYSVDFSLRKLKTFEYVRSPLFSAHGCGVKLNDEPAEWIPKNRLTEFFNDTDFSDAAICAHNALFDGLVAHEIYGVTPAWWIDTQGLARALLPPGLECNLDTLARVLRLGKKGKELDLSKGIVDLPPEIEKEIANYCINDTELAYKLQQLLYPLLPDDEKELLHMTIRMGVQAVLEVDVPRAKHAEQHELDHREELIAKTPYTAKQLNSRDQFADILRSHDIEPPLKLNDKGKETYAFSKQDLVFKELQADHPELHDVWMARANVASNNLIKRLGRLVLMGETGKLIMPLNYYGAHTGRWSGTGGINVQNLNRGSEARLSIIAPEGHVIVVADSAQIELRVNSWFCGQIDKLELLRQGGDVYSHAASKHFGYECNKKDNPDERQFGKMLELALGYNMGPPKFRTNAALGFMGTPPTYMTSEEAYSTVHNWRFNNAFVAQMWKTLQNLIPQMTQPDFEYQLGCITFKFEAIDLPNGMQLKYPDLSVDEEGSWSYGVGKKRTYIYGGKMLENIIQALAKIVVAEQMLVMERTMDYIQLVSSTHDEALGVVKEEHADKALERMIEIMSEPPKWAPDLPVSAEGGYAREYSK